MRRETKFHRFFWPQRAPPSPANAASLQSSGRGEFRVLSSDCGSPRACSEVAVFDTVGSQRSPAALNVRHGTTTLFAALNIGDGTVIGQCQDRHRHQEWLKFLKFIDAQTLADRALHLILDNYATHKHPKV